VKPDDRIDEWARARAESAVSADFADRVVAAAAAGPGAFVPVFRVAAVVAAAALAALRVAAALAVFLPR
jgi:hypothetical protein